MTKSLMRTTSAADMSFRSWFITNERCGEGGGGPLAAAAAAAPPGAGGWWGQGGGDGQGGTVAISHGAPND